MKNFIELVQKLVDKLEEVVKSESYVSVFRIAHNHHCPYTGPTWGEEFNNLKEALDDLKESAADSVIKETNAKADPSATTRENCMCGDPGEERLDGGIRSGVHCDTCWAKLVSECRKRSW